MAELKPCPFCGKIPSLTPVSPQVRVIRCENAACGVEPEVYGTSDGALVEAWNHRAPVPAGVSGDGRGETP